MQSKFKKSCKSIEELHQVASECANTYSNRCIYYLVGEMGAGKTEWTKGFCQAQGAEHVQSPSFALENVYEAKNVSIRHFDLYRLDSEEDIVSSGIWDAIEEENDILIIEWANLINLSDLPLQRPLIKIEFLQNREIQVEVYAAAEA